MSVAFHHRFLHVDLLILISPFQEGLAEASSRVLHIEDATEEAVRALLRFLYQGPAFDIREASDDLRRQLLALADKYDIAPLKAGTEGQSIPCSASIKQTFEVLKSLRCLES